MGVAPHLWHNDMPKWKQIKRRLRRPLETGGYLLLKCVIPLLPRCAVTGLAGLAGRLAYLLPLREKRIGLKNIDAVFGNTKSTQEKRSILTTSFATFTQTMLDVFWFSFHPEKRIQKYVVFEEGPHRALLFEDNPTVYITAHMGSWEIMGQATALQGVGLASIAATVKNPVVNRILIQQREHTGQTIIPREGALKSLVARLRKNGKLAFVLDQNTSEREGGLVMDFLGLPTRVSPAPAALAYRTGTEIVLGFCLLEKGGRYLIRFTRSITPPPYEKSRNADAMARELTQRILDEISGEIRKRPEHWLWSYKHWQRVPGKTYPPRYPDY